MRFKYGNNGTLIFEDARICRKNFRGEKRRFNDEGKRNFLLIIDDPEVAEILQNDVNEYGIPWTVKISPPRNEDEKPFMYMPVELKYFEDKNDPDKMRGPRITLQSGDNIGDLEYDTVSELDFINIASVDVHIRPFDGEYNGIFYRKARLNSMWVIQEYDMWEERRRKFNRRDDDEVPFL